MVNIPDELLNKNARDALAKSEIDLRNGGEFDRVFYLDKNAIGLYDGNGDRVYEFYLNEKVIRYKEKSEHNMDATTEKMVKGLLARERGIDPSVFSNVLISCAISFLIVGVVCSSTSSKNNKKTTCPIQKNTTVSDTVNKVKNQNIIRYQDAVNGKRGH